MNFLRRRTCNLAVRSCSSTSELSLGCSHASPPLAQYSSAIPTKPVFEFVPLRPRILVLSAVSKRWRQAKGLSGALFPCRTHLTILDQSLTLLPNLLDLPALCALSAFECHATNVPEEVLTTLLLLCRSSLKYLHLTFIQSQGPSLADLLLKISSQPWSLTSLSLVFLRRTR